MRTVPALLRPAARALPAALVAASLAGAVDAQAPSHRPTGGPPVMAADRPEILDSAGILDRSGEKVPAGLVFRDHENVEFAFDGLFDGRRPVVLTFNYADCPKLCGIQLGGLAGSLAKIDSWSAGDKFLAVTVCLDPDESDAQAAGFRARVLSNYGREGAEEGWHFVRGSAEDVRALADAVGFGYAYDPETGHYAHAPVAVLLTPDGAVARYLQGRQAGLGIEPATLRLSLAETADGELRSFTEEIALFCFSFDPAAGGFVAEAWNITRIILSLLALALFGLIAWMIRIERRAKRTKAA